MRYFSGLLILLIASASCSKDNQRPVAASPTGPTAVSASVDASVTYVGGVSGPMDVLFPARNESFQFRNELEVKYATGLGRPASGTFVDREGEVVWLQEYIRYRVNGCDHVTALGRVGTQIDGGAAGGICAAPPEGLVNFPPRTDVLDARRMLETKYQQMARGLSSSAVDQEGSAIWIPEYLRYRTNACDHPTAVQKVFTQIDGGPVPATCYVPCSYLVTPSGVDLGYGSGTFAFELRPTPVACDYTASSDASWLTFPGDFRTGNGFISSFPYSVTQNNGGDRVGRIHITYATGSQTFTVYQAGPPFSGSLTLSDPFRSPSSTTECWFRSANTPCTLTVSTNLPGNNYSYSWIVSYFYGTQKTIQLSNGTSNTFTFTDQCGGAGASAEGNPTDLSVTVVVTDDRGNSQTFQSGAHTPPFFVRLVSC